MLFPTYNEFICENSYRGSHKIVYDKETTTSVDDLSRNGDIIPEDIYIEPRYYIDMRDPASKQSWNIAKSLRGKPNAPVTIYRGVPFDINTINNGDWITLSKIYAEEHILDEGHVISKKCKAKNVIWDGNDINEFAYFE
jgi:hypothetical protein